VAPARAKDQALRRALLPLIGKIDVELIQETNLRADREENKETPAQAARWLWGQISAP
jgi:osmoprotectant transport system permease protein